jgi:excisionase family DNA binding protein
MGGFCFLRKGTIYAANKTTEQRRRALAWSQKMIAATGSVFSGQDGSAANAVCAADPNDERLVKIPDAARVTSLSRSFIYQAMDAGKLPYHQFGRARRLKMGDLKRFVDSCRVEASISNREVVHDC